VWFPPLWQSFWGRIRLPFPWARLPLSVCLSKAGSGSSGSGADGGASLSLAVVAEIQSTSGLLVPPLVAKESLAALEVLRRLGMAKRSKLLSKEELDLVDFLVTQVASLSSSLAC
jgi:hypothetical protein